MFSLETAEEIAAALAADGSEIALEARKNMLARSPTSVKVTLAAMRRARHLGIRHALEAELRLAENFMYGKEFIEGVNAKLISKPARDPRWNPPRLEDVSDELVEQYLGNRPNSVVEGNKFSILNTMDFTQGITLVSPQKDMLRNTLQEASLVERLEYLLKKCWTFSPMRLNPSMEYMKDSGYS